MIGARRVAMLALAAAWLGGASAQELLPRRILDLGPVQAAPVPAALEDSIERRLVVKFADGVRARATPDGGLASLVDTDLSAVAGLVADAGGSFAPLIRLPAARLAELEERAAQRSRRAQPDLAGLLVVEGLGSSPRPLEALGEALRSLPPV